MDPVRVTLIGKPGCHLCDDARAVIEGVLGKLAAEQIETELIELDILADESLARLHAESIPVVQIGDRRHAIWHVNPEKFEAALRRAAAKARPSFWRR